MKIEDIQKQVDNFNEKHPVGSKVNLRLDSQKDGSTVVTVNSPATILGTHTAVGWFKEVSGCYSLSNVVE